tara:strand:- start:229 stop:729 length:501 start_codon:yes stop_codon:yes gene_type:complete
MMKNPRWARYWSDDAVIKSATIGSVGRLPAPGTWGSLVGILFYLVVFYNLNPFWYGLLLVASCYFAIGICGEAEKRLKKVDPGEIIIDEVIALPICFMGLQPYMGQSYTWMIFLAVFGLFRFFDILKPLGIKKLQRYYGGFGVVIDDVAAGVVVCVIMNVALRFLV